MKPLLLCLLPLLLIGCAGTQVRENGALVFKTQMNAKRVVFRTPAGTYLEVEGMNHSGPTMAGSAYVKKVGDAFTQGAQAFVRP